MVQIKKCKKYLLKIEVEVGFSLFQHCFNAILFKEKFGVHSNISILTQNIFYWRAKFGSNASFHILLNPQDFIHQNLQLNFFY